MESNLIHIEECVTAEFQKSFQVDPEVLVYSPGRVNLIGDHTDYNEGFVLPMAIDRYLVMAIRKRSDDRVTVISSDFQERIEFSISQLRKSAFTWGEYITGCFWGLIQNNYTPRGFDAVISGNIPVGASLSSSAALELGVLRAAAYSADIEWDPIVMAKIGQKAENHWVGMNCGIMDQAICAAGKEGHASLIDCRDISVSYCPVPSSATVIIMDTSTRRGLVDSAYNERRNQCNKAATIMKVPFLRDANEALLQEYRDSMDNVTYRRARHIISENLRVRNASIVMQGDDGVALGRLMYESHLSLRDDFEVSGDALNIMVETAMASSSCLGARMTGAGFAGCAVALVRRGKEDAFMDEVSRKYSEKTGDSPTLYVCRPSNGTTLQNLKI